MDGDSTRAGGCGGAGNHKKRKRSERCQKARRKANRKLAVRCEGCLSRRCEKKFGGENNKCGM